MGSKAKALERIERAADGQEVDHGWPSVPHRERPYLQSHGGPLTHAMLAAMVEDAPVQQVKLSDLTATQEGVGREEAEAYVEDPQRKQRKGIRSKSDLLIDQPIVVDFKGRQFIHDGHHRLFAAKAQGDRYAPARVVDADRAAMDRWAEDQSGED